MTTTFPEITPATTAAVDAAITSRRSLRAFLPTPVPRETVQAILQVASRAPSGTNTQPWQVHVLTGASLARLSNAICAAYDDPAVREAFPMADLIRESIDGAAPRPLTPYYGDVSSSIQRTWHPSTSVQAPQTPEETDSYMADVLSGKRLL